MPPVTRSLRSFVHVGLVPCLAALLLAGGCRTLSPDAPSGGRVRVLVDLKAQADLWRLGESLAARDASRLERRQSVVAALRRAAEESRALLAPRLEAMRRRGRVASWRGYSVVNRLLVEATPEAVRELARWPEVAAVTPETVSDEPVVDAVNSDGGELSRRSWAIAAIGADEAWRQGLDGRGVVVGLIDSGASAVHEQLRDGFRGAAAWLDPAGERASPIDGAFGHGTGVLSVAVGRNVAGRTLGVAPGAQWIACAALPVGRYDNVLLTECADWMLNVGQPDVLINAWSLPAGGCDRSLRRIVDAWRAAEILPVFAAGNYGPDAGSDRSPANYTGLYPGEAAALSVGAVDAGGELVAASSVGPNSCDGSTFPLLVAPGDDLLAAMPLAASTYVVTRGTSHAAALVAGAAAILLQHRPEASVSELEAALLEGAVDLGPAGPDSRFGHGRLDVPRALAALSRLRLNSPRAPSPAASCTR